MEGADMNTSTGMRNNGSTEGYVPTTMANVIIVTIFGAILFVGIVGNILVIVIIASVKKMRTTVNKCLFALALTDLVILIVLPFLPIISELTDSTVPIGADFCKFISMYDTAARISSISTFIYVTIDRYFAMCHPLKLRRFWTAKKMYVVLLAFWIVSFVMSVPFLTSTHYIIEAADNITHYYCYIGDETWTAGYQTFIIVFIFFFPIPIILILYGRMIHVLYLKGSIGKSDTMVKSEEVRGRRARGQVVIMLLVLIVIFTLSHFPLNLIILFYYHSPDVLQFNPFDKFTFILVWFARLLFYVNSASNPIIYFALSTNFRRAFHELFCCCANQKNTSQQPISMTSTSQLRSQ